MEVLVFGSANIDLNCYVQRLPRTGETLHGHKFATGYGGKGANQCVAAAKMGAQTAMIAKVGDDAWGPTYVESMKKEGINTDHMEILKGETTGIAQICVADNGENHIVIVAGANNLLSVNDVTKARQMFDTAKILVCQLETPVEATLAALQNFKGISILNAAPALANMPLDLLKAATIFCVNENEASLTSGCGQISNLEEAKAVTIHLMEMGANTVIVTLGEQGAIYAISSAPCTVIHVPTKKIDKVVDTTGAGDAFIGSLAYYMAKYPELALHQKIGAACEVAAKSVQSPGTQISFPTSTQIDVNIDKRTFEWKEI